MPSGPKGPDQSLIRQQQESMRKQEALLEQQLAESRTAMHSMKAQQKVMADRSEKAFKEAEARKKEAEENLKIKEAKTEYQKQKGISNITDKTRGRAGLKIDKQSSKMTALNPIESLVNVPV